VCVCVFVFAGLLQAKGGKMKLPGHVV